jgi:2-polyprenyl-6-methoxyphenol hydroxylase-like FAD-dependent oxidoreductase
MPVAGRSSGPRIAAHAEVLIVGAGPVGLLLANFLGRAGIAALVLEKRTSRAPGSKAIGITPTSLGVLQELGLVARFLERGVQVRRAAVHDDAGLLSRLELGGPGEAFPFILSLPQVETEALLQEALARWPSVELRAGQEAIGARQEAGSVSVRARGVDGGERELSALLLCACDGAGSPTAGFLDLRRRLRRYPVAFRMADYTDASGLGAEAHLFFTRLGSVESFPMAGGRRRWITQATEGGEPEPSFEKVEAHVRARTAHRLEPSCRVWASAFRPERSELERFRVGRVVFCGDAAHTMPPIGGQGMNTGFADARLVARVLERALRGGGDLEDLLGLYEPYRRAGFRAAARRSRLFMGVGTLHRPVPRALRSLLVPVLTRPPLSRALAGHFTMVNVPYSTLAGVLARESRLRLAGEGQAHEPPGR